MRYTYDMDNATEITTAEAAQILGVSARHVGWYYARGLLPGRRIGARMLVFRRTDVEQFQKPKKPGRPKAKPAAKQSARAAPKKRTGTQKGTSNGK